ncbi:DHHW family protein [Ornithinibacillus xuwenensis]|uniref:DHHW family protein n=1 Tax=Ornithinibacillus xuwenensis TaxID=3144668 RepID=A0ABU9XI32_9BACI
MKNSIGEIIVAVLFFAIIISFGAWNLIKPDESTSILENRKLEQRPDFTIESMISGNYFGRFQTYHSDQFPLRSSWIELKSKIERIAFGQNLVKGTYISDDGYLIQTLVTNERSVKPEEIASRINTFASNVKDDVDIYFSLIPNKTTIMEEKIPDYIVSNANKQSDLLLKELANVKNITALDLRDTIEPHSNEENLYFFTDHHWKPKGAHYAYEYIINRMRENNGDIEEPIPSNKFTWEESEAEFYGSDARRTTASYATRTDTVTIVTPKFEEEDFEICYRGSCDRDFYDLAYLDIPDKYTNRYMIYFSGDVPEGIIRNPNVTNNEKLLILKDSYANPLIQFLSRSFSETRVLDLRHYNSKTVYEYIEDNNITTVLFVHNINSLITTPGLTDIN